jgi:Ser/Thr protein kinase RdoA (MazF antagonist)
VVHTHELTVAGPLVTKRYRSWERGEHVREWAVLRHVYRHAPDLVPRPVAAQLDARPPAVTMSLVPGEPLAGSLTASQSDGLVAALTALWAVPHRRVPAIEPWADDLAFARRLTAADRPAGGGLAAVAYDAALAWWDGPDPALLATEPRATVLGHRDANLANYVWDGERVRIVDFEDARVSDAASELALLIEHLSFRGIDGERLGARFDVDRRRLRAARRLWAMFWLRLLLPGGGSAERNPPGTAERQAQRLLDLLS